MAPALKTIKLNKIYLDLSNPRHELVKSESEAMQQLLFKEDIKSLAKHIAQVGMSPLDLMALIPHPKVVGAYTTAEGNRRLCALKVLLDPDKAHTEADKRYFHGLKKGLKKPISEVSAMVFLDVNAARPWVELRHKGEQNGRGTKAWGTDEKARFDLQANTSNPNARALLLVDYAKKHCLLSDSEIESLNLTTLTRYLSNRVVRHTLGIADAKILQITAPIAEFETGLIRFLCDSLGENPDVHSRSSALDREAYAENLRKEGVAPAKRDITPYQPRVEDPQTPPDTTLVSDELSTATLGLLPIPGELHPAGELNVTGPAETATNGETADETTTARDNRPSDKRKYVIKSNFAVRITDRALKDFYDELKTVAAAEFTFSTVYLLRSVIERGTAVYLKRNGIAPKQPLHEKIGQLADQLKIEGKTDRELKILRAISRNSKDDHYSPDNLGHFIHGGAIPEKTYAFRYWDSLEPIMRHILNVPK